MTLRLLVFTAEATAMTGDVPPSDRTQPTVRLDVAHATPIDLGRAIDAYAQAIGTVSFVSSLMNELVDHLYA